MIEDRNDEERLSPEEQKWIDALPRERDPGQLLEERTVRALRARGFLRRRGRWVPAWGAAAAVALFAGGFAMGRASALEGPSGKQRVTSVAENGQVQTRPHEQAAERILWM